MKLNYKRTILVGFAFFLICAFWQAYDNTIPLILTNKFGMSQTWSGVIMALDNILALFLLPLFGAISDRSHSKKGRRTPFIVVGTLIAAVALVALSFVDMAQLNNIKDVSAIDDPAALVTIYEKEKDETLLTPDGVRFTLADKFSQEEFAAIFRSPAVALMPDVTVKPLRSKANAIINLMGSAGGILVLVLGMVFATASVRNALMSYTAYFAVIAAIMLTALVIFLLTVREPVWAAQMVEESVRYGLEDKPAEAEQLAENADVAEPAVAAEPAQPQKQGLSPEEKKSMIFILLSIVLWFFGYNAVTSKYSVYASNILHKDYNLTLIIAQAAAIISYLPVGMIASKVGRKKTIRAGVIMLAAAFGVAAFLRDNSPSMLMNAMFALAGIAWATINVNSFPMVVEMCSEQDVGRYTGLYYTASMAAQVATPMLSGLLMDKLGMTVLFPYAAVFSALALVSLHFVHHGDSRPEAKKGLDALEDMDN